MVSSLAKDVTEYLGKNIKLNYMKKDKKFKIAYHSACSMQHGQKIHQQPMDLLKKYNLKCWGSVTLMLGERNLVAKDEAKRAIYI